MKDFEPLEVSKLISLSDFLVSQTLFPVLLLPCKLLPAAAGKKLRKLTLSSLSPLLIAAKPNIKTRKNTECILDLLAHFFSIYSDFLKT